MGINRGYDAKPGLNYSVSSTQGLRFEEDKLVFVQVLLGLGFTSPAL
jgi:hypothetical protein